MWIIYGPSSREGICSVLEQPRRAEGEVKGEKKEPWGLARQRKNRLHRPQVSVPLKPGPRAERTQCHLHRRPQDRSRRKNGFRQVDHHVVPPAHPRSRWRKNHARRPRHFATEPRRPPLENHHHSAGPLSLRRHHSRGTHSFTQNLDPLQEYTDEHLNSAL